MSENEFSERYKKLGNASLLEIIDNPGDYQLAAVEAAKKEFESRNLSAEQLASAREELELKYKDILLEKEREEEVKRKIKSVSSSIFDSLNPIPDKGSFAENYIRLVSLAIAILFFYQIYTEYGIIRYMFSDEVHKLTGNAQKWDLGTILFLLPFVILPASALLIWFKKRPGWLITVAYFTYNAIMTIPMFIFAINRPETSPLDRVFARTPASVYIAMFLFFGGVVFTLCRNSIREIYSIERITMIYTLCTGFAISLLFIFGFQ